jgi:uncharacterized protein (DUF433 family)
MMTPAPRITIDPNQMPGVPCIRGLRIPVTRIASMVTAGITHEQILADYPDLENDDILAAISYSSERLRN